MAGKIALCEKVEHLRTENLIARQGWLCLNIFHYFNWLGVV